MEDRTRLHVAANKVLPLFMKMWKCFKGFVSSNYHQSSRPHSWNSQLVFGLKKNNEIWLSLNQVDQSSLSEMKLIQIVASIPKHRKQRWDEVFCSYTSCFLTWPGTGSMEISILTIVALTGLRKILPPFRSSSCLLLTFYATWQVIFSPQWPIKLCNTWNASSLPSSWNYPMI